MTKLNQKLMEYLDTFGEGFPMSSLGHQEESKIIEIINDCISKGKDVYDSGYLSLDDDIMY